MDQLFVGFTFVLGLATVLAIVARLLKLPLIVAYIFTGVALATLGSTVFSNTSVFQFFPEIGVAFLLFLVGMELDFREMAKVGFPAIILAVGQMLISGLAGFTLGRFFGLGISEAVYTGIALSFSSTIVVVKLLADRKDEASLHGRLSVGILLIEDLVAIFVLMALSLSTSVHSLNVTSTLPVLSLIIKAITFFAITIYLSRYILPSIFNFIARSTELLFLSAIALCFVWVTGSIMLGFSLEIGAFLAGLALASSPYRLQIAGRMKPLRDFFITLFFINLGTQANLSAVLAHPWPFFTFTFYALLVKPLIFLVTLGVLGYRKHTSFLTSINLTQISEFSLIVLVAGRQNSLVTDSTVSTFALVAAVSIALSSILIMRSKKLFKLLLPLVSHFERKTGLQVMSVNKSSTLHTHKDHIVVVGCHRSGGKIVEYIMQKHGDRLIAVDFNPDIVQELASRGVTVIYGDASDPEILAEVNLPEAKLLISTIRDLEDNEHLLAEIKAENKKTFVIMTALSEEEAARLRWQGADKVVLPLALEGQHIINFLSKEWFGKTK